MTPLAVSLELPILLEPKSNTLPTEPVCSAPSTVVCLMTDTVSLNYQTVPVTGTLDHTVTYIRVPVTSMKYRYLTQAASYTGKLGEINIIYLHNLLLSRFWNTA